MSDETQNCSAETQIEFDDAQRKADKQDSLSQSNDNDSSAKQRKPQSQPEEPADGDAKDFDDAKNFEQLVSIHTNSKLPPSGAKKTELTNQQGAKDNAIVRVASSSASRTTTAKNAVAEEPEECHMPRNEDPPARRPYFTDFGHFKKETDYDGLFDASKNSQNVIATIKNDRITRDSEDFTLIPVDWLGVPLAPTTLPDFRSTTKLHFKIPDPREVKELTAKRFEPTPQRTLYDQFANIKWVPRDLTPKGLGNGHAGKHGIMSTLLPHPKNSVWNVPETRLNKIRKNDPMEYISLLDPLNVISTEKAMYQWILKDESEIGLNVTVGNSVKSSGFLSNELPHLPLQENRDFQSVYKKSFCTRTPRNDIEGLAEPLQKIMSYPGYQGGASMRDVPSAFVRFAPNVLKTQPNFLDRRKPSLYRRAMSARPVP